MDYKETIVSGEKKNTLALVGNLSHKDPIGDIAILIDEPANIAGVYLYAFLLTRMIPMAVEVAAGVIPDKKSRIQVRMQMVDEYVRNLA